MASKTELVYYFATFYIILATVGGFIAGTLYVDIGEQTTTIDEGTGFFGKVLSLLGTIIIGYSSMPVWITLIIFTPPVVMLVWLILSSLPTLSGGS